MVLRQVPLDGDGDAADDGSSAVSPGSPRSSYTGIGLAVHVFTALGAGLGFLALTLAADRRFSACFAALGAALLVDGLDGALARTLGVRDRAPQIDGVLLDLVVDYVTYVAAPLFAMWRSQQPADAPIVLAAAMLACVGSAVYFADKRMKTRDHWFRGFPACWNVLVFYLLAFHVSAMISAGLLLVFVILLFVPVATVHPLRVSAMRALTLATGGLWLVCAGLVLWRDFSTTPWTGAGLLATAFYFVLISALRGSADRG